MWPAGAETPAKGFQEEEGRMKGRALMLAAVIAVSSFGGWAFAGNQENCDAEKNHHIIFSGTDAGAARRGLNAGTVGCSTGAAGTPFVDTNYLTPGATHLIPSVTSRTEAEGAPTGGVLTHQDGSSVSIQWSFLNGRWEGQSIPTKAGTGTVRLRTDQGSVSYQKIA